jgi:indolepyruvate ferredoxin oxidoreductase
VAGDDHVAKSSTAAHQSDHIFKACGLPVFFPSSVQEILDFGLHALAMSRFAGVWAGMKTIQEIVESSASVQVDADRVQIVRPEFDMPPGGVHIRWPDTALEQEARLFDYKWYAALAYIRANRLNHTVIAGPQDRLGIMASGKAYNDTRQAMRDLGLDEATCRRLGLRLHKVGVVWPLEAQTTREFATGLQEILVIEEKRQVIEYQLKEELYNWRADVRPHVLGKFDDVPGDYSGGEWSVPNPSAHTLLRASADLTPALIAKAIAARLKRLGVDEATAARMDAHLAILAARESALASAPPAAERTPWFCSGCPHNTSTKVPEGSRAMAGIGCHFMALWMDRSTAGFTQMGGEGVPWVGQAPFVNEAHVFANIGDGTYFHSGLLAIRQSIAAGVNITYKILYNDAVAMTGGQPVGERPEGHSVPQIAHSVTAEGARQVVVVTDEPEKYQGVALPAGVGVHHRDALDALQRQLREVAGCTVIIYDQTCATEKRRRRKRGTLVDPARRVVINELVCEGCGDCSVQSNCLSVEPLETEFGRKRQINQSSCNKDMSCVKGFCPSFVTIEGGQLRKKARDARLSPYDDDRLGPLPEPQVPALMGRSEPVWGLIVAGVGGTGVITIGQLLGMAAHLEGKGIVTQDAAGLAQKGGSTWSHVLIAPSQHDIRTTRVGTAAADLVLACDPIVGAHKETLLRMRAGRTQVALNGHTAPTAAFVKDGGWASPGSACQAQMQQAVGAPAVAAFDMDSAAVKLMGDSLYANPMLLGFAWQKGWVPLELASILRAIELNEVAIDQNKAAFTWGRRAAHDGAGVQRLLAPAQVISLPARRQSLDELVERRSEFLTAYQDAAYAARYRSLVERVRRAELPVSGRSELAEAVARNLFKLMAYKDEYEVARLHTDAAFAQKIQGLFEGDYKVSYHLAPPLLARKDAKGHLIKRRYGAWMRSAFALLARLKGLRGTAFDVFGYTDERRSERALIGQYCDSVEELIVALSPASLEAAIEVARIAEQIKGYGHVKERNLQAAQVQWQARLQAFRAMARQGQQQAA